MMLYAIILAAPLLMPVHDHWINHGGYTSPTGVPCCGETDCPRLADDDVMETKEGYFIKSLHEFVPFSEATPSEDGHPYRCHGVNNERRCFFIGAPGT